MIGAWRAALRDAKAERKWLATGRPAPPPHVVKYRNIMAAADIFGAQVFVETGTANGDMVARVLPRFERIVSIELFPPFAAAARRRFAGEASVRIVEGDSAVRLGEAIDGIAERILFWLDGHYSGPGTGRGQQDSPVVAEIATIARHRIQAGFRDLVLIDDARLFAGENGYPALDAFMAGLARDWDYNVACADDCIFALPKLTPR